MNKNSKLFQKKGLNSLLWSIFITLCCLGIAALLLTLSSRTQSPISNTPSSWETFRHEVYPYEIKYPKEGRVEPGYLDPNEYPETFPGQEIGISKQLDSVPDIRITGDAKIYDMGLTSPFDLEEYVKRHRTGSITASKQDRIAHPELGPVDYSEVEEMNGKNWKGYQYTTNNQHEIFTILFIHHDNIMYIVDYSNDDPSETAIIKTLRFTN